MVDEFKKFLFRGNARGEEPTEATPAPSDEAVLLAEIRDLLAQRSTGG